ncbi:class D sortase [Fictibacillus sp. KIGAM418]|uniref:Class D sortase n=1 Tax=Fictibacillus marinisediminis TaxID=2878389 RepID=A0A9X1XFJ1_9BACL|nr:class D sortase [Fictibacillus marinisediminis]MCK6259171.1 class D sortase [Fictibacillus marinisediminis]
MERRRKEGGRRPRKAVLLSFSIVIILVGLGMFSKNIISYSRGYFAGEKVESKALHEPVKKPADTKKENQEAPLYAKRPAIGEKMGILYIPKLEAKLPIYHGTNEDELEKGVGHFKDSVLPGEKDNSVLSGHRDTVFRSLGKVGKGDKLEVTTSAGTFTYKVRKVRIVDKDDRTVIVPKPRAVLTVSTCYPFNYIGSAPKRYILEAFLISSERSKK